MKSLQSTLRGIRAEFLNPFADCNDIINSFVDDMNDKKSLKMLSTHVFCNSNIINGEYLALDFGGSNVRVSLYEVLPRVKLKKTVSFELRGNDYDYTTSEYSISDIFEMAVDKMEEIIEPNKEYLLGHTFSFAMSATSKNKAKIVSMSKGFKIRYSADEDINECLRRAIEKRGLNITPVAILNDTTATLLAGVGENSSTNIACILGTGHNMCFIDNTGEAINTESGGFNSPLIPLTVYDKNFLKKIPNESDYLLEVLVGGKNSAKLASEIVESISSAGLIKPISDITSKMMSKVSYEELTELDSVQNVVLREVSEIIYKRAAYLIACEIVGVLRYLNIDSGTYNVVFDGSVYEKTPYFRDCLNQILEKILGRKVRVTHMLIKDGSGRGAAIACAMK